MRGFAAVWVVIYHVWNRFYPGFSSKGHVVSISELPTEPLGLGAFILCGFGCTWVTLFFVLSGFCIHLPQAKTGSSTLDISRFARRRFWRLYPAYLASIIFSVIALLIPKLLLAFSGRQFDWLEVSQATDAAVNAAFLQQIWPDALKLNGVYWTLLYEVQFYLAYPLLLWSVRKCGLLPTGVVLLASEVVLAFTGSPVACFFPDKYFEWYLGVIAAEMIVRGKHRNFAYWVALAAIGLVAGCLSVFVVELAPLRNLLFAIGYFGLLLLASKPTSMPHLAFSMRWPVAIGVFSYSLYLTHVPVIDLIWVGFDRATMSTGLDLHRLAVIAIPASLAFAFACYRLFERPFLEPKSINAKPQ